MDDKAISLLNKGTGSKTRGISIFAAALVDIINFFGNEGWTDSQILDASEIFYDECYWFCFPELKHFVKKCKTLKFGKMFGKFNTATFIDWMAQYSSEAHERRAGYFGKKITSTWVEPENIVPQERVTELVESLKLDLTMQQADQVIKDQKARQANIDRYQQQMKDILELRNAAENEQL